MGGLNDDGLDIPPHGWLVIACRGGWEDRTRRELERHKYQVWSPVTAYQRMNRGTPTIRREPFIPGYVFVAKHIGVSLEELEFGRIRNTIGVIDVISEACGAGEWRPAMIGHPVVMEIDRRCDEEIARLERVMKAKQEPQVFMPGDEVEVITGHFTGLRARVPELFKVSPHQRITLLLDFFGAQRYVSLRAADVAKT